jgi:hypothetical protein
MTFPVFASGDVLNASDMNGVGLWLVKTQTIATSPAPSSVVVSGAFSSDYENYLITVTGGTMSVDTALGIQLGSTTTGYYGTFIYGTSAGVGPTLATDNNGAKATYVGGGSNSTSAYFQVLAPNLAKYTRIIATGINYSTTYGSYSGTEASATQHTAFTLIPFSGTITGGTIRVYGIRN